MALSDNHDLIAISSNLGVSVVTLLAICDSVMDSISLVLCTC